MLQSRQGHCVGAQNWQGAIGSTAESWVVPAGIEYRDVAWLWSLVEATQHTQRGVEVAGVQVRVAPNTGTLPTNVLSLDCWQLWHKKEGGSCLVPKLPTCVLCTFLILVCLLLQGRPETKKLPSKWNEGHMKSCLPIQAIT